MPSVQFLDRMMDIPAACRSLGTHSAHCADRADLTGTVLRWLWTRLLFCNDKCSAVAVLVGVVQFLDKVVVPVGATTGVAQCLVRRWIHVLHHPGWLMEVFYDFLYEG